MMDRLTEKQSAGYDLKALNGEWCNHYCHKQDVHTCVNCGIYQAIQKLAHYEDMEEQGKLLILPCKTGDTVYSYYSELDEILPYVVEKVYVNYEKESNVNFRIVANFFELNELKYCIEFDQNEFGKTVFLTEQEAKEALDGMEE